VGLAPAGRIIGKDTVGSIRGGVLFGFGAMCDALVARYRKIFGGRVSVIATGGNSPLMKRYAKSIRKVDELLTLKGLFLLSCRLPSKNA
jgi:type III pantothenate kinase